MYIERCKHGSEGGLYKPTIEIWQGGIFLPYSYITLHRSGWQQHNYVACCGTSFLPVEKMLDRMSQVETVFLCLDNDVAGHTASKRMADLLAEKGIVAERLTPELKDWNDDLTMIEPKEVQGFCQTLQC